jgi:hypothetical protein
MFALANVTKEAPPVGRTKRGRGEKPTYKIVYSITALPNCSNDLQDNLHFLTLHH